MTLSESTRQVWLRSIICSVYRIKNTNVLHKLEEFNFVCHNSHVNNYIKKTG